jgi:hypothetical protein
MSRKAFIPRWFGSPCLRSCASIRANVIAAMVLLVAAVSGVDPAGAETSLNANSAVGLNLADVVYYSTELPFIDYFKSSSGFSTNTSSGSETNEEQYLNLDANGWPKSLTAVNDPNQQRFTKLGIYCLDASSSASGVAAYPAGQYIVRYQGQGTMTYSLDAVKDTSLSTPGRDVLNVANPSRGIFIWITSTDPNNTGNYLRNIQVVYAPNENALLQGQVFNPTFLSLLQNYRALRFMDWFQTNGSTLSSWSNRASPTAATWAGPYGVPYEIAIKLANAISADAWFNMPVMADDNFMTQFATLAHSQMGTTQNVYVELSNEVWNTGFSQSSYATAQGQATWPNAGGGADYNDNWFGMRTAQMCDIWKSVWGADSSRVICVMGAFIGSYLGGVATSRLNCPLWTGTGNAPCAAHGIGAVAIAPYFDGNVPGSWTSQSDGGLASFFASLTSQNDPSIPVGGFIGHTLANVAIQVTAVAPYNLPLIAYEAGQGFSGSGAMETLFFAGNRDPRMQAAYATYLQGWKNAGGHLLMHFKDMGTWGTTGEYGALESIMQTTSPLSSAPPKWQALENFMSSTPCWWTGCSGVVAQVPLAPAGVAVH